MFSKNKNQDELQDIGIVSGMIMLNDYDSFDVDSFTKDWKNHYDSTIQEPLGDNTAFAFTVDDEGVIIAYMDFPIPKEDIEDTARYAYNWMSVLKDTKEHKSHLIISLIHGEDQIKRFKIFTQIICSLLRTTNATGVYVGNQSLLIPKDDYLNEADLMSAAYLPINLWIYFGLRTTEKGNSGYTYGLEKFGKHELEIVDSEKDLEDIRALLYDIAHYVLSNDITFKDGQTGGGSEDEKIAISFSKGRYVEGNTFKFAY